MITLNKIKIILSYILGLFISISIPLLVIMLILKGSVFNDSYIKRELSNANYYDSIYNEIVEGMKDYVAPTGLPDSIIDGVVDKEKVSKEINNYIDSIVKGNNYEVNVEGISEKVKNNIDKYLKEYNLAMDESNEFDLFIKDIENVYTNEIKLYKVLDKYVSIYPRACNYINKGLVILSVLLMIMIVLMFVVNFRMISSSFMGSGIILVLLRLFIIEDIDINNINLFNEFFSTFIRNIFSYISFNILIYGVCLGVFGFFLSLFVSKRK